MTHDLSVVSIHGPTAPSIRVRVDALGEAIDSPADARAARGTQGMAAVRTHYSFDAWAGVWRKAVLA